MMNNSKLVSLGEVAKLVSDKVQVSCLTVESYVSTENMLPHKGGIVPAEKLPPGGNVNEFVCGDTLFSNIRTYFKKVWHAKIRGGASPDVIVFRSINKEKINDRFLYYVLSSDGFIDSTVTASKGTKMPRGDKDAMRGYKFMLPSPPTQRRIASILSAYDDLIENNTRRIAILEEMARRIYEEWFVHFRFPGHEKVRMVESELGLIPEGWTVQTVEQTFKILGGGTPSKAEPTYWDDGTINWYSPTDLTRAGTSFSQGSSDRITPLGLAKSSAKLFPAFSVMLTSRATIGVVAVNTTEACTNQGFIICLPNDSFPLWILFHWVKANIEIFISLGTGATFKEITKGTFKGIKLVAPIPAVADQFTEVVSPLMKLSLNLQRKNENLRATRDLLLPKLISGELDVSHLPEPEKMTA